VVRIAAAVIVLVAAASSFAVGLSDGPPRLAFDQSVPADLQALAAETWDDFLEAHPARLSCVEPLTLSAVWELETRAEYLPSSATAVVRVPGTAPNLRHQLVHEFAHHLEFTCPDQTLLRGAFAQAQGFRSTSSWFGGDSWEEIPSEHYAEATAELVLGRRSHHANVRISDAALEVVADWARGG
jgi:hypothetical protein